MGTGPLIVGEVVSSCKPAAPDDVAFSDYLKIIDYKTASLMATCCRVSGIVSASPPEVTAGTAEYGYHLGMSYQLIDDVNDHDSVYYDRNTMLGLAIEEANLAIEALSALRPGRYRDRLADLSQLLLRRAG